MGTVCTTVGCARRQCFKLGARGDAKRETCLDALKDCREQKGIPEDYAQCLQDVLAGRRSPSRKKVDETKDHEPQTEEKKRPKKKKKKKVEPTASKPIDEVPQKKKSKKKKSGKMKVEELLMAPLWAHAKVVIGGRVRYCSRSVTFDAKRVDDRHGPYEVDDLAENAIKHQKLIPICRKPKSLKPAILTRSEADRLVRLLQKTLDKKCRWVSDMVDDATQMSREDFQIRFSPNKRYKPIEMGFFGGDLKDFADCYNDGDCLDASVRIMLGDDAQIVLGYHAANGASELMEQMSVERFREKLEDSFGGIHSGHELDLVFSDGEQTFIIVDHPFHQMDDWPGNLLRPK